MSERKPDIAYIPTPDDAVEVMLELAQLCAEDVVYDLGCGDGRFLIRAAEGYGCSGVGIDLDGDRLTEAQIRANQAGVGDRVTFIQQDLFETDFRPATVVILYLLPHLNLKLRPQLFQQLQKGDRILSHQFDMDDWPPQQVIHLPHSEEESTVYLWVMT
ncbi:class I SAM-dependent methyltransferase [Spirulina subsalsa FACHB-351]|uniref:Class I SAM-dependent methyltransferase n=1 Tax=Spirulina subsalsa FACHB-351 TaxID=234711 RepID=A0ABT3L5V8_9CYAN|nr:class I SAM-dependent methyltransferase [Spirulina subsalsa]MCW6036884.1 class I SAM-dependent methyltransferase [Spirulina subsalsa FACHB-351]